VDKALDYSLRSLEINEALGNPVAASGSLLITGTIYHLKGDLKIAKDYLQRSYTLQESIGHDRETSASIFSLILVSLDLQDQNQALAYFDELTVLQDRTPNKVIQIRTKLTKALILKQNNEMKDIIHARTILTEIINQEPVRLEFTVLAIINLCEIYLKEIKLSDSTKNLTKVKELIKKLNSIAQNQQSHPINAKILLIEAKIAVIEGNIQQAQKYLEEAGKTAEEQNLGLLIKEVNHERQTLKEQYN
ncbi:MAG: hypothetical protein ACXAC7_21495, partial [Candidatus Hodarchaeales archaeon]